MNKFCPLLFIVLSYWSVLAQPPDLNGPEICWGVVHLDDKTSVEGRLQFYDAGKLKFIHKNGDSEMLSPAEVERFEFNDASLSRMRYFASLPFKQYKNSVPKTLFLEVLKELDGFALLSLTEHFETQTRNSSSGVAKDAIIGNPSDRLRPPAFLRGGGGHVLSEIRETIYFLNASGEMEPYFSTVHQTKQKMMGDREKVDVDVIDKKLIQRVVGERYETLRAFADEKDLSFFNKEQLIQIFEYYANLRED